MVGKTVQPTKEQASRMQWIGEQYGGCLPCLLKGQHQVLATVQHVTKGRKRLGHDATYGLCEWHHFGHLPKRIGPSLAHGSRVYQRHFGSEELLVDLQTWLIDAWQIHFWVPYHIPAEVVRQLRELWVTLRADDPYYEG